MRIMLWIVLAAVLGLQGCVVPAAVDAMQRYTHYDLVMMRQIDSQHFFAVITIEHSRGAFDPLGGHGSGFVTQSVDAQLWHLSVTDTGVEAKKSHSIILKTDEELDHWHWRVADIEIDAEHNRIIIPQNTLLKHANNLHVNTDQHTVYGVVNGRECNRALPSDLATYKGGRNFLASDSGDQLMIVDNKSYQASIFNVCNAKVSQRDVKIPFEFALGFSTTSDGSLKSIRGRTYNPKAELNAGNTYEVQLYPNLDRLSFSEKDLGLAKSAISSPNDFIFDDKSSRFHWLVIPEYNSPNFKFITYDFASGALIKRDASFSDK